MIIPDVNLLIYAYNTDAPAHRVARRWWEELLSSEQAVRLPWVVSCGFVRLMTHKAVRLTPFSTVDAVAHVRSWLVLPNAEVLNPGPRHLEYLAKAMDQARTGGNLVTDAHIAAMAMEVQAEVHSNDADFARFSGLRWHNPLA